MLITCPECEKQISDRATSCPGCGFPIADHLQAESEDKTREEDQSSRQHLGEVDCAVCDARGFRMKDHENEDGTTRQVFDWCVICEHSGRAALCQSSRGYFAVSYRKLDEYLKGAIDEGGDDVRALGTKRPGSHRYPNAGPRKTPTQQGGQAVVVESCDISPKADTPGDD